MLLLCCGIIKWSHHHNGPIFNFIQEFNQGSHVYAKWHTLTNCMNWICKCLQKKKKKKVLKYTHLQPTYQNILFWQLPLSSLWKNKQTKIQFFRIRFVTLGIKSGVLEWIMSPLTRAMLIPLPTLFFTPLITLQPIIWKGENIWIHLNIKAYKLKEMGDL